MIEDTASSHEAIVAGRKGHPERLGAAGAVRSPHHAAHRRRLVAFYEQHAPEKVKDCVEIKFTARSS